MNKVTKVSAIIAAGGNATRLGKSGGKQLLKLKGSSVISYSINTIRPYVDEIILVIRPEDVPKAEADRQASLLDVDIIVAGGNTRTESVLNALRAVNPDCEIVLIHDGARPFVSSSIIINSIESARASGAAVVAVPVKDTIKEAELQNVKQTLDRSKLWSAQTPQTFSFDIIKKAYEKVALSGESTFTDDSALVESLGYKVTIVLGSDRNFKITTEEDLKFAEYLLGEE